MGAKGAGKNISKLTLKSKAIQNVLEATFVLFSGYLGSEYIISKKCRAPTQNQMVNLNPIFIDNKFPIGKYPPIAYIELLFEGELISY